MVPLPDDLRVRRSLCCGHCRRRTLPPSTLFFGPKVYWFASIILVVALRQTRPHPTSMSLLCRTLKVSPQTVRRWTRFFAQLFPSSPSWQAIRGKVSAAVSDHRLPLALLEAFDPGDPMGQSALRRCLVFISTGSLSALTTIAGG